jgi:pimeloyl-ACP methyl ester carboxylesterase
MTAASISARKASRRETIEIRGLATSLRRWGATDAPLLLMVHGIRDCAATFQFVVDHLQGDWQVVAPDWRGHGYSARTPAYWFHDFVADLSALVDLLSPAVPLPIIGHSLGGNIAGIYAGLRPGRVSHLVSLDGFGPLVDAVPVDARALMREFLDLPGTRQGRIYPDLAAMVARLREANPRLTSERALFLAEESSAPAPGGGRCWLYAPEIRNSLPSFRAMDEWERIWAGITAPALWIESSDLRSRAPNSHRAEMARRAAMMPAVERVRLEDTGHNLHHDAPEKVAALVSRFLAHPATAPTTAALKVRGG